MIDARNHHKNGSATSSFSWAIFATLILLSSIIRGGNRGVILIALEWLALGLIATLFYANTRGYRSINWNNVPIALRFALGLLLFAPLYGFLLQYQLSRTPTSTLFSYLSSLPILACFLFSFFASDRQAIALARLWLIICVFQSSIGLLQVGTGDLLRFDVHSTEPVLGTFASKNSYSNLLVMGMPLAVAFLLGADSRATTSRPQYKRWAWSIVLFALLVTVLISTSRTGIATGLLVLLLSAALLPAFNSDDGRKIRRWVLAGALGLIALGLLAGGVDWAMRFEGSRLTDDNEFRAEMRAAAVQAVLAHLPLGSGLGSFPWVSSEFQPAVTGRYWFDLAHSDYLQLLSDTGLLGLVWIVAALALYLHRGWVLVARAGQPGDALPLAAALGLLAFGLHAWVDYPFHIPANAMMAATLFGLMLRENTAVGGASYKK